MGGKNSQVTTIGMASMGGHYSQVATIGVASMGGHYSQVTTIGMASIGGHYSQVTTVVHDMGWAEPRSRSCSGTYRRRRRMLLNDR